MFKLYPKLAFHNLRSNYRVTIPYLLSGSGIIMMYYMLYALAVGTSMSEFYGVTSSGTALGLGIYIIAIFGVIFLFYTNSFLMKRRKKELGLYNILGMEKRHIAGVILSETLMTAVICLCLGIGLGIVFSKVFFLILERLLGTVGLVPFTIPPQAIRDAVVIFGCIFLLTALYNILQVRLSKPIELLHGGETGEKEPKAHWLLAVLGLGLLGAGYYMAVTIQDPITAMLMFFVAVILVILGTYLLFMVGITAMLKLLKKNPGFYYKTRHFTTVSGMLYRMKQNAAGLASICILFTCLLVSVSTTFCLYNGVEDVVRDRCPRDENFTISAVVKEEEIQSFYDKVQEVCEAHNAVPENVIDRHMWQVAGSRVDDSYYINYGLASNTYAAFEVYTLEDYHALGGEIDSCAADEVLLFDPSGSHPSDHMTIFDKDYRVTKTDFPGGLAQSYNYLAGYQAYAIVINDPDLIQEDGSLETSVRRDGVDDTIFADPSHVYNFDLPGADDSTIIKIYDEINEWVWDDRDEGMHAWSCYTEGGGCSTSFNTAPRVRADSRAMYGGIFFLGLFMGAMFLMGTVLIMYYKQVSEGYEDAKRFDIMQKVGMSRQEVKSSIHSQVLMVFFLPLLTAVIHLCFAFPMLQKILGLMQISNFQLIVLSMAGCVLIFSIFYLVIYLLTARTYYKIVESAN